MLADAKREEVQRLISSDLPRQNTAPQVKESEQLDREILSEKVEPTKEKSKFDSHALATGEVPVVNLSYAVTLDEELKEEIESESDDLEADERINANRIGTFEREDFFSFFPAFTGDESCIARQSMSLSMLRKRTLNARAIPPRAVRWKWEGIPHQNPLTSNKLRVLAVTWN